MKWKLKSLDELGFVSRGKSKHRPRNAAHLYGGCYPFIQTADVKHSNLYINQVKQYYSDAGLAQSKLWSKGTLCITIAANIADTAILGFDACFPDSIIGFVADDTKSDTKFVKYLFNLLQKQYQLFSQGATQDNLSQEKLLSLKFKTPPLSIQKKIASILSAYDDLIENNLRRIELLEQSARELYTEWFVRFKFPGYENVKFVDGLPEGWERKKLGDEIILTYGKALKSVNRIPGEIPVYGSSGVIGSHTKCLVTGPGIIVGRKGNVGSVFWEYRDFFPIDTVYYINNNQSDLFTYYSLLSTNFDNSDGAVPGLNRNYAYSRGFIKPLPNTISKFHEFIIPIHNQLNSLKNQNQLLKQARDLLLPRLMKGEVNV